MSWIKSPTQIQVPSHPSFRGIGIDYGFWIGQDYDDGYFGFYAVFEPLKLSNYIITKKILPDVIVNGTTLVAKKDAIVNGYVYFGDNNEKLYMSNSLGWVFYSRYDNTNDIVLGSDPIEYSEEDADGNITYYGDSFYTIDGRFPEINETRTLIGRGALRNKVSPLTISCPYPRYESENYKSIGKYNGVDGIEGTKVIGLPQFKLSNGKTVVRSLEKVGEYFVYGDISYKGGKWIIGTVDSASGWWEGEEPSVSDTITFVFKKPQGSTVTGSNITVKFDSYIEGDNKKPFCIGDVAICR